jgi:hypothetical protein
MPRLDLLRRVLTGSINTAAPMNGALAQSVLAADGAQFDLLGGEILFGRQTVASAITVTIVGVADEQGRSTSQTISVAATIGHVFSFGPFKQTGWRQPSTGKCHIDVSLNGIDMVLLTTN